MLAIDKFKELLHHMQPRLGMYIADQDFPSLVSFLDGYLICYKDATGVDVVTEFREWMFVKYKRHFALHAA